MQNRRVVRNPSHHTVRETSLTRVTTLLEKRLFDECNSKTADFQPQNSNAFLKTSVFCLSWRSPPLHSKILSYILLNDPSNSKISVKDAISEPGTQRCVSSLVSHTIVFVFSERRTF